MNIRYFWLWCSPFWADNVSRDSKSIWNHKRVHPLPSVVFGLSAFSVVLFSVILWSCYVFLWPLATLLLFFFDRLHSPFFITRKLCCFFFSGCHLYGCRKRHHDIQLNSWISKCIHFMFIYYGHWWGCTQFSCIIIASKPDNESICIRHTKLHLTAIILKLIQNKHFCGWHTCGWYDGKPILVNVNFQNIFRRKTNLKHSEHFWFCFWFNGLDSLAHRTSLS